MFRDNNTTLTVVEAIDLVTCWDGAVFQFVGLVVTSPFFFSPLAFLTRLIIDSVHQDIAPILSCVTVVTVSFCLNIYNFGDT